VVAGGGEDGREEGEGNGEALTGDARFEVSAFMEDDGEGVGESEGGRVER
jgi:hypothetical protein